MNRITVLCSGGLDCVVATQMALQEYPDNELTLLHFDYGQVTAEKEHVLVSRLANYWNCSNRFYKLPNELFQGGPEERRHALPPYWVPARNLTLLSCAASWCETNDQEVLVIGTNVEEATAFPDNSKMFTKHFASTLRYALAPATPLYLYTPLAHERKTSIIQRGQELKAPLHLTWSCYTNDNWPCHVCPSCLCRENAFFACGLIDPLVVGEYRRYYGVCLGSGDVELADSWLKDRRKKKGFERPCGAN